MDPMGSTDTTLRRAFALLTADERQLITAALAGNYPPRLASLRLPILRALADGPHSFLAAMEDREPPCSTDGAVPLTTEQGLAWNDETKLFDAIKLFPTGYPREDPDG